MLLRTVQLLRYFQSIGSPTTRSLARPRRCGPGIGAAVGQTDDDVRGPESRFRMLLVV
jgi:hypothetical protein